MSPIVDSIVICNKFYGQEIGQPGWFPSFNNFRQKEQHSFFKTRNRADVGVAYNTQFSRDNQTEPFKAMSIGVAFIAPSVVGIGHIKDVPELGEKIIPEESAFAHWFRTELPLHCSLQFKTGQDIRAEINCLRAPPGWGVHSSGSILREDGTPLPANPVGVNAVVQGVPEYENRFQFEKLIDIHKNMQIEAILTIGEPARRYLADSCWPGTYIFNNPLTETNTQFPVRYMIQVSLLGIRYTQKRGEARS